MYNTLPFFIKLNNKAEYVFRLDIFKEQKFDINEVLSVLVDNSNDLTFPGYPYGLLLSDRFARVSNEEKEYLRTLLQSKIGNKWSKLSKYVNLDVHEILDNIS